jgi:hypothetical protein
VLLFLPAGHYRLFAWMEPEPLQVGDVHLSVVVMHAPADGTQNSALDVPITDAVVTARFEPASQPAQAITVPLPAESGLGGFYYEADIQAPTVDQWRITLEVSGDAGVGSTTFEREVVARRQVNWLVIGGAGLTVLLLIGLMGWWNRVHAGPAPSRTVL